MANLINGNGFQGITAQVDADLLAGLTGGVTGILPVGAKMVGSVVSNTPRISDGVILTKEGRRIQVDSGSFDEFTIPAGTAGVTAYYLIGYKLVTGDGDIQTCETFVQASTATGTIAENTLKGGSSEVYISVYRVIQTGLDNALSDCLLPVFAPLSVEGDDEGGGGGGDEPAEDIVSYTKTFKGLSVTVDVFAGKLVFVNISGNTNTQIATKSAWETVGNYANKNLKPRNLVEGYTEVNSIQSLRYYWDSNGVFKIGYGRNTASGAAENVANGYVVNLHFAFAL